MLHKAKKLFFCNLNNLLLPVALLLGIMVSAFYIKNIYFLYRAKLPAGQPYSGSERVINADEFQSRLAKPRLADEPVDAPQEAAPLRDITLTGIIASNTPGRSLAIVMENGEQHTYREGDMLSAPPEGIISKIGDNTVEITERGNTYNLILVDPATHSSNDQANNILPENTAKKGWDDYIITNPVYQKGTLAGLRIMPGPRKEMFTQAGLRPGDIVIKIDEYDLTDPSTIEQARLSWQQSFTVQLVIMRNNQKSLFNLRLNDINEKLSNNHAQE